MKAKHNIKGLFLLLLFVALAAAVQAQTATPAALHQKDYIGENPTADRDLQIVSDYLKALADGDLEKVRSTLASNYMGFGPGPRDSADVEKEIKGWQEGYKTQLNRKIDFVSETHRVLSGNLMGNWVSVWGNYSFDLNDKKIRIPFQSTMRLTDDGKIDFAITYYDRQAIMETLGYKLTPPATNKGSKKQ